MDSPGRTLRRRKLSKTLRRYRREAGLSMRELAKRTRLQTSTISRIESGEHTIMPRNVQLILQACGVGAPEMDTLVRIAEGAEDVSWWVTYSDTVPDWFRDFVDLETDAEVIRTYASELVDGLLQTKRYATAVAEAGRLGSMTEEELQRAVELREARQARLDTLQLHVVMNEAVVRRTFGDQDVMREQFERLADLSERDNLTIQVLPFAAGGHPAAKGPFTLMRFPEGFDDMDLVYVETENGGIWQERASDIDRYNRIFTRVTELALSPEETRSLLISLI